MHSGSHSDGVAFEENFDDLLGFVDAQRWAA